MDSEQFEYVGFWIRVVASLIDSVLLIAVTTPLIIFLYGHVAMDDSIASLSASSNNLFINLVLPAAAIIIFWLTKQATPGKMVFGAKVVDAETGGPLNVGQSIGRYLGYYVAMLPCFLGFFWIGFDARKQGWHDKLAGTVVIRPKRRGPEPVRFTRDA